MLARKISPRRDIVRGLVVINPPLFFRPDDLQLVVVASVALTGGASTRKGWGEYKAKKSGASQRYQNDF
jgi:hypothetical protein